MSTADLNGYTALVSGGRLKIGFETALRLLRCGARVVITTRFEDDARRRFSRQADYVVWKDRLQIYAADFRSPAFVEDLVQWLCDGVGVLDILINNAAQTVRRPPAFYRHLIAHHDEARTIQTGGGKYLLQLHEREGGTHGATPGHRLTTADVRRDPKAVAELSQLTLMPGDKVYDDNIFPQGRVDEDGQQEDRRDFNSWIMKLEDIHLVEFLEVMYVNVITPFMLCSRLKKIMKKKESERPSFIVNVTAMEGNFYDPEKNCRHPHTNMAKAALNMMTRTSASDFRKDRIFMNSVDPGWITNEKPFPLEASHSMQKTKIALDQVDGASRVCDPIFRALNENEYFSGLLFKNYMVYPW
jgi:NAD(P)-dependent dehydrogenase (short-subunit alcohol dehydrogenase family)